MDWQNKTRAAQDRQTRGALLPLGRYLHPVLKHAAFWGVIVAGVWCLCDVMVAKADEALIDCHDVDCFQRAECNRRILAALSQIKASASETRSYQSPAITARHIEIQLARQDRLRSFLAPECQPTSPKTSNGRVSSGPSEHSKRTTNGTWRKPIFARPIDLDDGARKWLQGRWDGWLHFHDGRSVRLWFQITDIEFEGYVKACSDQGMVMGRVTDDGVLQLPRPESLAFGSRILLWRSPPHYYDLEGIVVLEIEPRQELDSGLVWLSRALSLADFPLPTDYPCQDKEILDRRKQPWIPYP
jgi:hypothetical protein